MKQQKAMQGGVKNRHYLFIFEEITGVVTWCMHGSRRYLLGRAGGEAAPDIVLKSSLVSRMHGEFLCMEEELFYVDRGSLNGTFFNGEKLQNTESGLRRNILLKNGDILRIDGNDLRYPRPDGVLMLYWGNGGERMRWYCHELVDYEYIFGTTGGVCVTKERQREGKLLFAIGCGQKKQIVLYHGEETGPVLLVNRVAAPEAYALKERDLIQIGRFIGVLMGEVLYFSCLPKEQG